MQWRNQDALVRIRKSVVNHKQALAEQMAQREAFKPEDDKHIPLCQEEFKGVGGFAGSNSTK
ncbi:Zinc finger NHR/GATA-type [Penicillium cosmopolitanum]|uniref:Zinc finger NHR/GATA-type n=1 Tax=Penicillium cosmopolitanum TaxID=1131564 RepID=A0A9W9W0E6_9EURO|nr:Zinc finger NHR/GATA-type [Penicillium cosmopolitanum]KAJ5394732.1 Zinc finger NHR/GATA-type [Penicillium cosmopolitanum]